MRLNTGARTTQSSPMSPSDRESFCQGLWQNGFSGLFWRKSGESVATTSILQWVGLAKRLQFARQQRPLKGLLSCFAKPLYGESVGKTENGGNG